MRSIFFIATFLCVVLSTQAQQERVLVSGYLQNELNEPLEGIAIFNNNSLEGTISTSTGSFKLQVAVDDRITFKAVNYKAITLVVTQKTLDERVLAIRLREGIHLLDEIVLNGDQHLDINIEQLQASNPKIEKLTGNGVGWTNPIDRIENSLSDLERRPDQYELRHDALEEYQPQGAFVNILGALAAVILKKALNALNIDFGKARTTQERFDIVVLKNQIESQELIDFIDIKPEDLYEYMYFATDQGLNETMMHPENELYLLQFLSDTATEFKKRKKQ